MNIFLKIVGIILLIVGFVLTIKPNLVSTISETITPYQMIEKRVIWGILIGLGLFLICFHQWSNWRLLVCAILFFITLGIIIARLFGFVFNGFFSKQLFWLSIEIAALIIFGIFYRYANH